MVMGYALFNAGSEVIGGPQQLRSRQLSSTTFTLTTGSQDSSDIEIPQIGDLVGLKISITASATGTLVGPNKLNALVREIAFRDVTGEPILQAIAGSDLNYLLYVSNASGTKITETDVSGTSATDTYMLQMSVDKTALPGKLRIGANAYSAAATSGATGGSVTVELEAFYRDEAVARTQRVYKQTNALVTGTNEIGSLLNRKRIMNKLGLGFSEALLTSVLVSSDGSEQLNMKTSAITSFMDASRANAHISGKLLIPCTPFLANDKSRLQILTNAPGNADIYQFLYDSE